MKLAELADLKELQKLCESFTAFTNAVTAIIDLDGNIFTSTGWRDICTNFHRVNPHTALRCRESDTVLSEQINNGDTYKVYKCKNGLIDVAVPLIIGNQHVANFFTGQFFFEKPDKDYFICQAEKFGFDKKSYMDALDRVPVYSEEYIFKMMNFLTNLARVIGESEMARKKVEAIREQLIIELNNSEKKIKTLSGLLPICASCKKIRNDEGYWEQIETYVSEHTEADFSHSICPDCAKRLYPELII